MLLIGKKSVKWIALILLALDIVTLQAREGQYAYVANGTNGTVSIIDTSTQSVIETVAVGEKPTFIAVSPDGKYACVTNYDEASVSIIDTSSLAVKTIHVGANPCSIAFLYNDEKMAYVTNQADATVSMIDMSSLKLNATLHVGAYPSSVASDTNEIVVANEANNTVSLINEDRVIQVGDSPCYVLVADTALFPGEYRPCAFVANHSDHTVSVIGLFSPYGEVIDTISVGNNPSLIVSCDRIICVMNQGDGTISHFPWGSEPYTVSIGPNPNFMAATPDGRYLYVTHSDYYDINEVAIFDPNKIPMYPSDINKVPVGSRPSCVAITPDGKYAYVTNWGDNTVSIIDTSTQTVINTVGVGPNPSFVACLKIP